MKKKGILIDATGGSNWIGGLYYKKNILCSLLENESIVNKFSFVVLTEKENIGLFEIFDKKVEIVASKASSYKEKQLEILFICFKKNCDYIFPGSGKIFEHFGKTPIHWIADFQHNKYSEFFSDKERDSRTLTYSNFAKDKLPVVLSSNDAFNDFMKYYNPEKSKIYVVRFVSYIEEFIKKITLDDEKQIIGKYGLTDKKYACVMNQFWQHKNHIVVLKALDKYFGEYPNSTFQFVFTGQMKDDRNPQYIETLKAILEKPEISRHVKVLGFIDREEQIAIMKNAEYVIQPSLFEGWGTVVEDAKVLDKTVLLSDIPVHQEQKNEKCILFDPYDAVKLAELIAIENGKEHVDDIEAGIADMYKRAREYSKGFEQLLENE